MRFKVDENLHPEVVGLLKQAGHDALSVGEQGLRGTDDANLATVCGREGRAFVTLDGGFGDIRTYPHMVKGRRVLLFDDLFRSGATMNSIAAALYDEGQAVEVFALTMTKTRSHQ